MAKTRMLRLDYDPTHKLRLVWDFLTKVDNTALPQLPHSLHLANGDFPVPQAEIHIEMMMI
jgi:hypothetical protein